MKKEEYLKRLEELLKNADPKEKEAAIEHCTEYFEDAEGKSEEEILKELGTPEEFSKQILGNNTKMPRMDKKWLKWGAIAGSILLVIGFLALLADILFGIELDDAFEHDEEVVVEKVSKGNGQKNGICALEEVHHIELKGNANVILKKGDKTEVDISDFQEDEVLIEQKGGRVFIQMLNTYEEESTLIVTVKDDLKTVDVENASGNIQVDSLSGKNLELETAVGNIDMKDVAFDKVSVDVKTGTIEGTIKGDFEEYGYEVETQTGTIHLQNQEFTGPIEKEEPKLGSSKKVSIECVAGTANIQFKE